jgi:hypothetical protein
VLALIFQGIGKGNWQLQPNLSRPTVRGSFGAMMKLYG